jgi:pimeloyl-ACP methyl ester carboxylesterase
MAAGPDGRAGHRRGAAGRCHTLYGAYGYLPAQAGRGSPVVLLSPGAAWVVGWKEQFPVLAREHSAYVVDLPGQRYTQLHDRRSGWNLAAMTVASCDHAPQLDCPEQVNPLLIDFLRDGRGP